MSHFLSQKKKGLCFAPNHANVNTICLNGQKKSWALNPAKHALNITIIPQEGCSALRIREIELNLEDMSLVERLEPNKVKIIVLDGRAGKAKMCEAVHHGLTIIETAKGKTARIKFEESELFN